MRNSIVYAGARYYRRNFERHVFSASLSAVAGHNLDAENQVLLGGDNGLRGYPLRYQAGERSVAAHGRAAVLHRLVSVAAVPRGLRRVHGRGPRHGNGSARDAALGTLYDVGVGLRLSSPRSSGRSIVHIDLAFPLNGDPSIDKVQLVVETKSSSRA